MYILFTDVDGVLNSDQYLLTHDQLIDPDCASYFSKIRSAKDAKIVLTSSWRELPEDHAYRNNLSELFGPNWIGQTKNIQCNRPLEIAVWLMEHKDIDGFVILDDDFSEKEYKKYHLESHLVHTSFWEKGLEEKHMEQALQIFNIPYDRRKDMMDVSWDIIKKYHLNMYQEKKFRRLFSHYKTGDIIYPSVVKSKIVLSKKQTEAFLDKLVDLGYLVPCFQVACPDCGQSISKFLYSIPLAEAFYCEECDQEHAGDEQFETVYKIL